MPTRPCRVSALDDIGDPDAPPGSASWAKWMIGQAKLRRQELQRDVTGLQEIIKKLERHEAWTPLGFISLGMLCHAELDLDDREVDLIRQARPGTTLEAVIARAKNPPRLPGQGRRTDLQLCADDTKLQRGSNNADYLTARIARDRPDILDRMKAGEFPSVRSAGIAAGIVKVPTALDVGKKAWFKMTQEQRTEFLAWLYTPEASA